MATRTYRLRDLREIIQIGNSQGLTIDAEQLQNANMPVGTEVVVNELDGGDGLKIQPRE